MSVYYLHVDTQTCLIANTAFAFHPSLVSKVASVIGEHKEEVASSGPRSNWVF